MVTEAGDSPFDPKNLDRKPEVSADEFFALDIRVGRVVSIQDFPEARKPAWKLEVNFGPIVGILKTSAQITNYSSEELEGRLVVGAINLGRKHIAGFTSEFLVLGSMDPDGTVRLLQVEEGVGLGAPIG
ncbi:MAG: tRNA-binding protein [Actinomycetota bacterium]